MSKILADPVEDEPTIVIILDKVQRGEGKDHVLKFIQISLEVEGKIALDLHQMLVSVVEQVIYKSADILAASDGQAQVADIVSGYVGDVNSKFDDFGRILFSRLDSWRASSIQARVRQETYVSAKWRVDNTIASDNAASRIIIPTVLVQVETLGRAEEQGEIPRPGFVDFELNRQGLGALLDSLEGIKAQLDVV
mmetsp:Transcript_9451/g.15462  ORF Transcript_9451/g.15462 Transcript_9451/m.15462 type:complete len:194 (+) Transcript_9451:200-781(+)